MAKIIFGLVMYRKIDFGLVTCIGINFGLDTFGLVIVVDLSLLSDISSTKSIDCEKNFGRQTRDGFVVIFEG